MKKFFLVAKSEQLVREIENFAQYEQESLSKTWDNLRDCKRVVHTMATHHRGQSTFSREANKTGPGPDVVIGENLVHKLTNVAVEIIEAMASNACKNTGDRRILKRPIGVHQVEASSSNTTIHQKLDVLAKHIETLMKALIQMMTPAPLPCL